MAIDLKTWLWIHKYSSLICTLFMLLLCVTGLPLIFAHEIDEALGNAPAHLGARPGVPRADLDDLAASARRARPGEAIKFLVGDPDDPGVWYFSLGQRVDAPETTSFLGFDAVSGRLVSDYPLGSGLMSAITHLHVDLFAGLWGMLFLGFMGLLLVVALVSGVVLYAPFMRHLGFGQVRRDKSAQTRWLDLHNFLGIVTLVWLSAVSVTGVINTLSVPIFAQWQRTELAEMTRPHRADRVPESEVSTEGALSSARTHAPGKRLSFMAYPGGRFASPSHFVAFMAGTTPLSSKLLTPLLIDARTGRVVDERQLPWYATLLLLSQPLHFGDYGGLPLKILWALLDLVSIGVLWSGLVLWWKKWRGSAP